MYVTPPTPLLYATHHRILVMAISCKKQAAPPRPCSGARVICIYIYIYIYINIYIYTYNKYQIYVHMCVCVYGGLTRGSLTARVKPRSGARVPVLHAALLPPLYFPHDCNTIARLLRNIRYPSRPDSSMPYTIEYRWWQFRVKANPRPPSCMPYTIQYWWWLLMICLPPQGTPPPHSSRHDPQRTQHTASTAATPPYPQGKRETPCVNTKPLRRFLPQVLGCLSCTPPYSQRNVMCENEIVLGRFLQLMEALPHP